MGIVNIYNVITKSIPKLSHFFHACIIYKGPLLPCNPNFSTEHLKPSTCFHINFNCSTRFLVEMLPLTSPLLMSLPYTYLDIQQDQIPPPHNLVKTFVKSSRHHGCKWSIFYVNEGGDISRSAEFMKLCFDHEVIVETIGGYALLIKGKVGSNYQTTKNTLQIQVIFYI